MYWPTTLRFFVVSVNVITHDTYIYISFSSRKKPMANDAMSFDYKGEELEDDEEALLERLFEEAETESDLSREEIITQRENDQEVKRQERYLARVAYRARLKALRKETNEQERETNRRQRVHERDLVRSVEK